MLNVVGSCPFNVAVVVAMVVTQRAVGGAYVVTVGCSCCYGCLMGRNVLASSNQENVLAVAVIVAVAVVIVDSLLLLLF